MKTPTRSFFYISVENVWISTKFLRNVYEESSIPLLEKFNIFTTTDVMLTSDFRLCNLSVLPLMKR